LVEKEVLESYFRKQGKAFSTTNSVVLQNYLQHSLVALFTKLLPSKLLILLSSTSIKVVKFFIRRFFIKATNNGKLTRNKCKKSVKNNFYLYYRVENHKLDFYSKKKISVTLKNYNN